MDMATKVPVRSTSIRMTRHEENDHEEKKGINPATVALAAVGITAIASAIYFLGVGERGARNREKVKSWATKAREEIMDRLENIKDVSAEQYKQVVDTVLNHYKGLRQADLGEIGALGKELKEQWDDIKSSAKGNGRTRETRRYSYNEE